MKLSTKYLNSYALAADKWYNSPRHQAYHDEFVIEPVHNGPEQTWEPHRNNSIKTRTNQLNNNN